MSFEEFPMWSIIAMIAFISLPCVKCRCEGLGTDFCLDKQSFFHEETDLDEQAGTISEERQVPIKLQYAPIHIIEHDPPAVGRETRRATEKQHNKSMSTSTDAIRKPLSTDKYDDEAMMSKFIEEEEDVDREDHVTQIEYLSDLAVNTDNEITSLHVDEEPLQALSFPGADHDPFFSFVNDDEPSFDNEAGWARLSRDIHSSEEPSSEESDESKISLEDYTA